MFKFLGKHAAIGFGAGAGKAAMDHTVRQVMGLTNRTGRRRQREINPYSRRYTYTEFKQRYFKGENIPNRIAKEFWSDFRYSFDGGLQRYIKETTGLTNRRRAARGRRARPPIATVYDPASHRTAFAYSDGDVAFGTGSPKSFVPVGRVIAKDRARQHKLMVGWVYRNMDPRGKQRGRKGRRNCVCL